MLPTDVRSHGLVFNLPSLHRSALPNDDRQNPAANTRAERSEALPLGLVQVQVGCWWAVLGDDTWDGQQDRQDERAQYPSTFAIGESGA